MIFFENKLLQQPDVVFYSNLNDLNYSSLAPSGGEKKIIKFFFSDLELRHITRIVRKRAYLCPLK